MINWKGCLKEAVVAYFTYCTGICWKWGKKLGKLRNFVVWSKSSTQDFSNTEQ